MKPIDEVREHLGAHRAKKEKLIQDVKQYAPNVSKEHIDDVLDALWLLEKLE